MTLAHESRRRPAHGSHHRKPPAALVPFVAGMARFAAVTAILLPMVMPAADYWAVEDRAERERLPLYQIIPAATPDELAPANGYPKLGTFLTWERSHGDNAGTRYSALRQINRQNVTNLQV